MNNHPIEGRLRDALAAHAQKFSASPDAWQQVQAKEAGLPGRRSGLPGLPGRPGAGWLARHGGLAIPAATAAAVVAVALGATALAHGFSGTAGPGAAAASPAGGQNGPPAFVATARQVSAQWDRSPAARAWRTGLVLVNASDLTPIPHDTGFPSGHDKFAFESGRFRLAGVLPAVPLPGTVRWADGATLRLPVLSARAAFAELAEERPCPAGDPCGQLTVTGAEPSAVTVPTSRGPASVPAWRFTVTGLGWKVSEVAVERGALVILPDCVRCPAAGRSTPGVGAVTGVSVHGRTLTVSLLGGACDAAWGAYLYESGSTVVVGSWQRSSAAGAPCPAVGIGRTARVTLARPLGTRVVLDVASGLPLVPGLERP
jgi:hypothetical protein